jgi:hypothetical protein
MATTTNDGVAKLENPTAPDISEVDPEVIEYPEGGVQAWLVVFGSFLALFATWGVINSYVGIFSTNPILD